VSISIDIKVTVPEIVLGNAAVRDAIMQKMQSKTAPDLKRLFRGTVNGWKDKPDFLQKFLNSPSAVSTQVWPGQNSTGGKTYTIVNNGSPEHPIFPRQRGMLRFQSGYRAGTRPRVLNSRSSSRFGNYVRSYGVPRHPGFDAREFDQEIAEQYADTFAADMNDAITVATVRSA